MKGSPARPTSGPWSVTKREDGAGADIAGPGYTDRIAYVGRSKVEWEANAQLIAAAPDLLAALYGVLNMSAYPDGYGRTVYRDHTDAMATARAAIEKATGGAS